MIVDLGNRIFVDWTTIDSAVSPVDAYAAWAAQLGVSPTASLYAMDGDDTLTAVELASPFIPSGVTLAAFCAEAGLSTYLRTPRDRVPYSTNILVRDTYMFMYLWRDAPDYLLSWHPPGNCRMVGSKLQRAGATTILAGRVQLSATSNRADFALKLINNVATLVLAPIDQPVPVCATNLFGGAVVGQQLEMVAAGACKQIVATTVYEPLPFTAKPVEEGAKVASSVYLGPPTFRSTPEPLTGRRDFGVNVREPRGRVRGSTLDYVALANVPYACRCVLLRERDNLAVRQLWSGPDGSYDFQDIDELESYSVIAYYGAHAKRAVIADGLTLANGKVELLA